MFRKVECAEVDTSRNILRALALAHLFSRKLRKTVAASFAGARALRGSIAAPACTNVSSFRRITRIKAIPAYAVFHNFLHAFRENRE